MRIAPASPAGSTHFWWSSRALASQCGRGLSAATRPKYTSQVCNLRVGDTAGRKVIPLLPGSRYLALNSAGKMLARFPNLPLILGHRQEIGRTTSAYYDVRSLGPYMHMKLIVLLLSIFATGCSTTPVPVSERSSVPSDQIVDSALLRPSQTRRCPLTITRDATFPPSPIRFDVFLDGQPIARLAGKESITIYAPSGRHFVGVKPRIGSPAERDFTLADGVPTRVRIFTDQGGNFDIRPESGLL